MATILNIETSATACSVALSSDGMILAHREEFDGRNHATLLSGFIQHCLNHLHEHSMKLDAVAVSLGPGSYTGLRIGLSEAKGLAYALNVPLIGVDTLELMCTQVMFGVGEGELSPDTVFIPMVDARRMEVYTAAYNFALEAVMKPQALILEDDSYAEVLESGIPAVFFGSGADKARELLAKYPNARFVAGVEPLAVGMVALADRAYAQGRFLDLAYCTPLYLKEFQATQPKNKVL